MRAVSWPERRRSPHCERGGRERLVRATELEGNGRNLHGDGCIDTLGVVTRVEALGARRETAITVETEERRGVSSTASAKEGEAGTYLDLSMGA